LRLNKVGSAAFLSLWVSNSVQIKFAIRIADALNHKPAANPKPDDGTPKKFEDPFDKPHTKDLFLKQVSSTHSLMMNKFNVR
jgi:ATP adenylyltransferase/5',5'''-P-1,P-4-tetraphosphate phosphorylase II